MKITTPDFCPVSAVYMPEIAAAGIYPGRLKMLHAWFTWWYLVHKASHGTLPFG